jgi:pyrroloquinoline quinone biosynthesis protein D
MSAPESNCVPRLAPGCRLNAAGGPEDLLLIPEGALRLKGPARTIVELCNGERTLSEIVVELQRHYPSTEPARIETEAVALLSRLRDRGALKYE